MFHHKFIINHAPMKVRPAVKFVSIIAAMAILGAGCYASKTTTTNNTNTSSGTNTSTSAGPRVTMVNRSFSPSTLTVAKGTTVTWTNSDSLDHTVTGDTSGGPTSGTLSTGGTYSFTFNTAGTFTYHCAPHPDMTGTVTVTP